MQGEAELIQPCELNAIAFGAICISRFPKAMQGLCGLSKARNMLQAYFVIFA